MSFALPGVVVPLLQQDVGWLDVAVDNTAAVEHGDALQELTQNVFEDSEAVASGTQLAAKLAWFDHHKGALAIAVGIEQVAQRGAFI